MAGNRFAFAMALAGCAALSLAACDNGPSAVAHDERAAPQSFADAAPAPERDDVRPAPQVRGDGPRVDHRGEAALRVDGKAMWAATRRYSAAEGARRSFERNGADFGADDVEAYVRKAHDFVNDPPAGVERMARANGDTLFYDARANIFAVADRAGLPKTMFKPEKGARYWRDQKDRDSRRQTARREGRAGRDEG